jgi:carboxymethylenebutenolidase
MKVTFRMLSVVISVSLLAASIVVRADGPKTETVTFPNGKDTVSGFLAAPEKPGRYPGLIVVHEWWGLNDWVKEQTVAGIVYLTTRNDVERGRVGTIGWCMGGGYAVQLAMHVPRLGACVVNYGALPTDPNDLQNIGAPFLGNFGADDRGITPADVQAFQKSMETLGRQVDIKIYEGAGHGFQNPNNKDGYRPQATEDAWNRTIAFLNKSLK